MKRSRGIELWFCHKTYLSEALGAKAWPMFPRRRARFYTATTRPLLCPLYATSITFAYGDSMFFRELEHDAFHRRIHFLARFFAGIFTPQLTTSLPGEEEEVFWRVANSCRIVIKHLGEYFLWLISILCRVWWKIDAKIVITKIFHQLRSSFHCFIYQCTVLRKSLIKQDEWRKIFFIKWSFYFVCKVVHAQIFQ